MSLQPAAERPTATVWVLALVPLLLLGILLAYIVVSGGRLRDWPAPPP